MQANHVFSIGAIALSLGVGACSVATAGGLELTSADGELSMKFGVRLQYDFNQIYGDAGAPSDDVLSDSYFRRQQLALSGTAYGWEYKWEQDFAGESSRAKDAWFGRQIGPGKLMFGQFKVLRSMDAQTSSGETLFTERAYVQSNFPSHEYAMGVAYKGGDQRWTYGAALQNRKTLDDDKGTSEDHVLSSRVTLSPINDALNTLHLGVSASMDNLNKGHTDSVGVQYAGRSLGSVKLVDGYSEGTFVGVEVAGKRGSWSAQAEVMQGWLDRPAGPSQEALVYYVQTAWLVTGESRPYKNGVFKYAKPESSYGAVELKARYEYGENRDIPDADVSAISLGVNWYVNPAITFMLEYIAADRGAGLGVEDQPDVIAGRVQLNF